MENGANPGARLLGENPAGRDVENPDGNQRLRPRFPLPKEVLIEAAQPVATVSTFATCTALVLAQQGLEDAKINAHVRSVMSAMLFAYLPIGLFGLLVATAVRSNPRLVGLSSGFMLGHLLLPTVLGCLVNILKSDENVWVSVGVSVAFLGATVMAWRKVSDYPRFLHGRRGGDGDIQVAEDN